MTKKPGSEIASGNDSVGNDVGALTEEIERYRSFPMPLVLVVLREMFSRGIIDSERVDDPDYLWSVILENFNEVASDAEMLVAIHYDFTDVAEYALDAGKPAIVVVLAATAVEHILNMFYRDFLTRKGLKPKEIRTIIRRNNIDAKTGWLMQLAGLPPLPSDLRKRIAKVVELRNCIVHYKAEPMRLDTFEGGWENLKRRLEDLDANDVLDIPHELEDELNSAQIEADQDFRLAIEVYQTVFESAE